MNRKEILDAATKATMEDRTATHGDPEANLVQIAKLWSDYLGVPVAAYQVAICNVLQKISRSTFNPGHVDHYVDICGYAAIAGQLTEVKEPHMGAAEAIDHYVKGIWDKVAEPYTDMGSHYHVFLDSVGLPFGAWPVDKPCVEIVPGTVCAICEDKKRFVTHLALDPEEFLKDSPGTRQFNLEPGSIHVMPTASLHGAGLPYYGVLHCNGCEDETQFVHCPTRLDFVECVKCYRQVQLPQKGPLHKAQKG